MKMPRSHRRRQSLHSRDSSYSSYYSRRVLDERYERNFSPLRPALLSEKRNEKRRRSRSRSRDRKRHFYRERSGSSYRRTTAKRRYKSRNDSEDGHSIHVSILFRTHFAFVLKRIDNLFRGFFEV